jgi:hypothetical protein
MLADGQEEVEEKINHARVGHRPVISKLRKHLPRG